MLKKLLAKYEIKRIHTIIIFIIIIGIIMLIKTLLNYSNYLLLTKHPYKNEGFYGNCLNYVINNQPSWSEYQQSEWKNSFTYLKIANKEVYLTCFDNIIFIDYPSYFQRKKIKEYPLVNALENNLITFTDFENYFNTEMLDNEDCKIKDLLIFKE